MKNNKNPETIYQFIRVGTVQTTVDHNAAWKSGPVMSEVEQENVRRQVTKSLHDFAELDSAKKPHIILIPELSIPQGFLKDLQNIANVMECIIIAGMDYKRIDSNKVENNAVVIIPSHRNAERISNASSIRFVGKAFVAPGEKAKLKSAKYELTPDSNFWIFNDTNYGNFAVAICYDFLDLERAAMYRGKIQHLFILAYNKDIQSFKYVSEALCRMVFCNVVICNTGYFGGSLAISPKYLPYERTIYSHEGKDLYTQQVIPLPTKSLYEFQSSPNLSDSSKVFKSKPPGFEGVREGISPYVIDNIVIK